MCCGGSAPEADPLIKESANRQLALGDEAKSFFKTIYQTEIAPKLKEDYTLRQDLLKDARGLIDKQTGIADDQATLYREKYRPVEEQSIEDARGYDSADNVNRRMGIASAAVNQQFSNARGQGMRALSRYGVGLNPDAFARENQKLTTAQALGSAGAQTGAAFDTMDKAIALRSGVATTGRNTLQTAGNMYQGATNTANVASGVSSGGIANTVSAAQVPALGYNMGITANQSAGNLMLGKYNADMAGYQADQQATASLYSGIGYIGGMAIGGPAGAAVGGKAGGAVAKADGGLITGEGGPRDDRVDAKLSPGEYVLNEGAVRHFGLAKLNKMNEVGLNNQRARGLIRSA